MSQEIKDQISSEDTHLIELHQIGDPLGIYRLSSTHLFWSRWLQLAGIGICMVALILLLLVSLYAWVQILTLENLPPGTQIEVLQIQEEKQRFASTFEFMPFLLLGTGILLAMWFSTYIVRFPEERSHRIIACERGLLKAGRHWGKPYVEVVRWNEILAVKRRGLFEAMYMIFSEGDDEIVFIPSSYEKRQELLTLIKKRSRDTEPADSSPERSRKCS